jgi:hypothetical protein
VDWTTGVHFPAGVKYFSLVNSVSTDSGTHTASYPMALGTVFPETMRPGREADH